MTDTEDQVMETAISDRPWGLTPRCLWTTPDLTFEEFAEGPWASVRGTHESSNFWLGDALIYLDEFGEKGSQLLDDGLAAARVGRGGDGCVNLVTRRIG